MLRSWMVLMAAIAVAVVLPAQREAEGGDAVKAVNLEKLNGDGDEQDPCPTPDGLGLLYVKKGKKNLDIHVSRRASATAAFGPGKPFLADRGADVRSPFLHQGKYYFATNEVRDKKFAGLKNFDILWQTGTQAPLFVPGDVNSKADEMYPWVTPAGKEFYFSRQTDDGWTLFVANGPAPGPIGKAKAVGFAADFHRATVAGNGLTMYLQGPLDDGKIGIFRSKRAKLSDAWSKPEAVPALNHAESKKGDMQPALSLDGARLFFVSDRPGGKGGLDIWMVTTAMLK